MIAAPTQNVGAGTSPNRTAPSTTAQMSPVYSKGATVATGARRKAWARP